MDSATFTTFVGPWPAASKTTPEHAHSRSMKRSVLHIVEFSSFSIFDSIIGRCPRWIVSTFAHGVGGESRKCSIFTVEARIDASIADIGLLKFDRKVRV